LSRRDLLRLAENSGECFLWIDIWVCVHGVMWLKMKNGAALLPPGWCQAALMSAGSSLKTSGAGRSGCPNGKLRTGAAMLGAHGSKKTKLRQLLPQFRAGVSRNATQIHLPTTSARLNKPGLLVFKSSKTFVMGKVRFFFRASASIGKRLSASVLALPLLRCCYYSTVRICSRALNRFFVICFHVFFYCSAVRLLSVALHEKAEPPALPAEGIHRKVAA